MNRFTSMALAVALVFGTGLAAQAGSTQKEASASQVSQHEEGQLVASPASDLRISVREASPLLEIRSSAGPNSRR